MAKEHSKGQNSQMSRRGFLTAVGAAGAAACLANAGFGKWNGLVEDAHAAETAGLDEEEKLIHTMCRNCYGRCLLTGHVRNGRLVKVSPYTEEEMYSQGTLCSKAYAIPSLLYSPKRIVYPMKQVGERGAGEWVRISWDEAMDTMVDEIKDASENYGGSSIMQNNGTARDGMNIASAVKVFQDLGSVGGFGVGSVCKMGSGAVDAKLIGAAWSWPGWDAENASLIVFWGRGLFSHGAYVSSEVLEAKDRGAKFVVIDPRFTAAARMADLWLPVRPGSDLALKLCLIREQLEHGAIDADFVKEWTNGPFLVNPDTGSLLLEKDVREGGSDSRYYVWDGRTQSPVLYDAADVAWVSEGTSPELFGTYEVEGMSCPTVLTMLKDSVAEWTVEKTAEATWLNANDVRQFLDLYIENSGSTCYSRGQKMDMTDNASSISQATVIFTALAGNFEVPGGNYLNGQLPVGNSRGIGRGPASETREWTLKHIDEVSFGGATCQIYGQDLGYPASALNVLQTNQPVEPRFYYSANSDAVMMGPASSTVAEALSKIHFHVDCDFLLTATSELADLFLPAAHSYEVDRLETFNGGGAGTTRDYQSVVTRTPLVESPGECKDEVDLMFELSNRLGLNSFPWKDKYEFLDSVVEKSGMKWEEYREQKQFSFFPGEPGKHVSGKLRRDKKPGFNTSTGKVNIFCEELKQYGYGPLPVYREQVFSPFSEPEMYGNGEGAYPLVLMSGGRSHQFFHTDFHDSATMRAIHPVPRAEIHPETAEAHGIQNGDWVYIESPYGKIRQQAYLTAGIDKRVIHCEHDWWFPELGQEDGLHGSFICNANELYAPANEMPFDISCGTTPYQMLVKISKAEGAPHGIITSAAEAKRLLPRFDDAGDAVYASEGEINGTEASMKG